MLQGTLRQRREVHAEWRLRQVQLLLDAGVQRAQQRALSGNLVSEAWNPEVSLPYQDLARVEIQFKPNEASNKQLVIVTARIESATLSATDAVQRSYSFLIDKEDSTENES